MWILKPLCTETQGLQAHKQFPHNRYSKNPLDIGNSSLLHETANKLCHD